MRKSAGQNRVKLMSCWGIGIGIWRGAAKGNQTRKNQNIDGNIPKHLTFKQRIKIRGKSGWKSAKEI